ncbi:hypothetical protein B0T16DRAFT_387495 [Cercophora newfieldiana]|uniref:Uncharacterized protein n=1 Tax=Cercophora newfieldiana TaxID=92897 RepID=A0AA39YGN5_9PEZI|nr:hypothetical protein B0T16DRAFT_387495 [Cercophora newfieldiana]
MPPKRKAKEVNSSLGGPASRAQKPQKAQTIPDDDDDDFEIRPKPPTKRPRKAQPRAKPTGRNQDDAVGRPQMPTTVEQHLMDQNSKSKEFIQTFREEVTQGQEKAHKVLEQFKRNLDKAHAGQQQELFAGGGNVREVVTSTDVKENPLYQQTQHMLRLCRNILERHQTAEKESQRPGLVPPRAAWKRDEQEMVALLQYGRQYGEKLANNLVVPGAVNPTEVTLGTEGEGQEEVAGLFEKTREVAGVDDTWGKIAQAQMMALIGAVTTLPKSGKK